MFLLFSALLFSCSDSKKKSSGDTSAVHHDGFYVSGKMKSKTGDEDYRSFLKFYDDGTVIVVSSTGTNDQVVKWFQKGHQMVGTGDYLVKDKRLSFTAKNQYGSLDFSGTILTKDSLEMHTSSLADIVGEDISYFFIKQ